MKYLTDYSNIFTRFDLNIEVARQAARKVSKDELLQKVADAVVKGDDEESAKLTKEALQKKAPMDASIAHLYV